MQKNKTRIVILGAGESGVGAAILAQKQNIEVFVSDSGKIVEKFKNILLQNKIDFEENKHSENKIFSANEIIKSPGIPEKSELIKKLREKKISIISEIEFAGRYSTAKMICVTGSNGKTTTTHLIYHILKKAGLNVGLAGNVGQSLAKKVAEENYDYFVVELSSFQLDDMYDFKANIAVLLNITPDHLDRYEYKMQNYVDAKFRITQNQTKEDAFIYCLDDEVTAIELAAQEISAKKIPFTIKQEVETGAYLNDNQLLIKVNKEPFAMFIQELALQGKHNIYNSMAAGIAARILDVRKETIKEALSDFQNIEHRLEFVAKINDVEYINDSKATNINSAWYALESIDHPIIWIAGGVDKGNDYEMLMEMAKSKVKALICLGTDNEKLHTAFSGTVPVIEDANSAREAVLKAYRLGKKGDTVLLSPACASFDLFKNYEDRGQQFKAEVRAL